MTNSNDAERKAVTQLESIAAMIAAASVDYARLEELRESRKVCGSIISGTMRVQDLVPAFLEALGEHDHTAYAQIMANGGIPAHAEENAEAAWWTEEGPAMLESLFESLDLAAPAGTYFGSHAGDGSDYGFWLDEDAAKELQELEDVAGDCENEDAAWQKVDEDPLSVEVRSAWCAQGEEMEASEYKIVLCTGGPHVELQGELDHYGSPSRVRVLYRDWGTSGELFNFNRDAALAYAQRVIPA